MKKYLLLVLTSFLMINCSSSDDSNPNTNNDDSNNNEEVLQYVSHYSTEYGGNSEKIFYEENRIVLREEYVDDFLDYNHNYEYNDLDQLIRYTKIHSSSTIPIVEIVYEYFNDGTLKNVDREYYNNNYMYNFSYFDNYVLIENVNNRLSKVFINENQQITHVETYDPNTQSYYTSLEFQYNSMGNVSFAYDYYSTYNEPNTYHFTYDNKINPFFILDHELPNNLTIKKLMGVISHINFLTISPEDSDGLIRYFSNNNITSAVKNSNDTFNYEYEYDSNNYPTFIGYSDSENLSPILITY